MTGGEIVMIADATCTPVRAATPRITTRGCYDLLTGAALHVGTSYRLYPKRYFADMGDSKDLVIMVHGLRNDDRGASDKVAIARRMLFRLNPKRAAKYRVVGFSYDSNTRGAHIPRYQKRALAAGRRIAKANGSHLASFLADFKQDAENREIRVRLVGHSLGTEVIHHAVMRLARAAASGTGSQNNHTRGIVESIHFFGSSLSDDIQRDASVRRAIDYVVCKKLLNCYAPKDDVLLYAESAGIISGGSKSSRYGRPLGLHGAAAGCATASKYRQQRLAPENHRFASYADALGSFP